MIEVRELTKSYGPTLAVNQVSFEARAGEVVGFIGPNGAGKTTTMRILTCYLTADSGRASVAGFDVQEHPIDVRKNVGYLPESAPLYVDMGVVDYLKFMTEIREIPKHERKQRINSVIDICGLNSVVQKDIGELSKGFRQRVGLAQSLIHDPPILILDEPTSGLDPSQTIEIRNLIKEIGKEKLVLFSTHILPEVAATCSRILMINQGEIVANGTLQELISQVQSDDTVHLAIRGAEEEIRVKLNEIDGVTGLKHVTTEKGIVSFEITTSQGIDNPTEMFFLAAVENNWQMLELRHESVDLEQVFLNFTTRQAKDTIPAVKLDTEAEDTSPNEEIVTQTEGTVTHIAVAEEE